MSIFIRFIFILLTTVIYVYAEDIQILLEEYEEKADLSNKTKRESLGHLVVFTRKDLEIMGVNTLGEVLRTIPVTNFMPNSFGTGSLSNPGQPVKISTIYRLYIDDHEVSSIHTFSPFLTYDEYPLDNIDHIEIYYSLGAISVSNEPSQIIIKLYTKSPERENLSEIRLTGDTKKGYQISFVKAKQIDENNSYLVMFNQSYLNFDEQTIHNQEISRDQFRRYLFFKYHYYDTLFEISYSDVKRKPFSGFSSDKAPDDGKLKSMDSYIAVTQYLLSDNSLKIFLSLDRQKRKYREENKLSDGGIVLMHIFDKVGVISYYEENRTLNKYSISIDKTFKNGKNNLLIGTFLRYYEQNLKDAEYKDFSNLKRDITGSMDIVRYFKVYSLYAENSFNINANNLLMAGIRIDNQKYAGQKSKNNFYMRIGFISFLTKNLMFKGFASSFNIFPSPFELESAKDNKLNDIKVKAFTGEIIYDFKGNKIGFYVERYTLSDLIRFDPKYMKLINTGEKKTFNAYSLSYLKKINYFNKIEINYWFSDVGEDKFSPPQGGYLKLFTEFKNFYIYNELIYKGRYKPYGITVKGSLNYNLSLSYRLPYSWYIKVKGENLLNKGERLGYLSYLGEKGSYRAYDRKIFITVEKIF
ncbi:TonB-dependent receptor plug domain-containing protein [Persephonella sp.]